MERARVRCRGVQREGRAKKTLSVVFEPESEGLRQSARPACDQFVLGITGQPTKRPHASQTLERFGGPEQNRGGLSRNAAHDVDAGVNPVAAIGVESPSRAEHASVARRGATMGVRSGIAAVAEIGFDLDQPNDQPFSGFEASNESTADEFGGDDAAVASIEGLAKGLGEGHGRSIGEWAESASSTTRDSDPPLETS